MLMFADLFHMPCEYMVIHKQASDMRYMPGSIPSRPRNGQQMCQNLMVLADFTFRAQQAAQYATMLHPR